MRKSFAFIAFYFLTACTTAADVQRECRAITDNFLAEVSCIENFIEADSFLRADSFAQEYVYEARVLADQVRAGETSENEARLALAKAYNRMRVQQSQVEAYNALAWDRLRPYETDYRVFDDRIHCSSW